MDRNASLKLRYLQTPSENGATPYAPTTKQDIRNKQIKMDGSINAPSNPKNHTK
ncbi:hypothetical protein BDCR2A_01624 [Borrelia duttonii CR2A]|uniref:Uncharacterized protein n=1 Tax=Borrelia duttonii CR2A TaxID=1432657 RepID=W6TWG6_9SPIR|nr:hypothetical protein BDCR2A_01624 [Borrelia duttonii CR2A]